MRPGSVTHVVRCGFFASLHIEELGLRLIVDLVNDMGYGLFQMVSTVLAGGIIIVDSCLVGCMMPVNSHLAADFSLSSDTKALLPALMYGGSAIGMLCSGLLGDEYGRRWPIIFSYLGVAVSQTMLACVASTAGVFFWRFFGGVAAGAGMPCAFVLLAELHPARNRRAVVFVLALLAIMGHCTMDILGRLSMHEFGWRIHVLLMSIPAWVLFWASLSCLRDSPAYYAVKGDLLGLEAVLENIAQRNGLPRLGGSPYLSTRGCSKIVASSAPEPTLGIQIMQGTQTISMLVKGYPALLASLGLVVLSKGFLGHGMSYIWPRIFVSFPVEFFSPSLLYLFIVTCQCLGLAVAMLVTSQCTEYRSPCIVFMLMAMASILCVVLSVGHSHQSILAIALAMAKFALEPLGVILCIFKAEAFPTQVRATAFGVLSFCGWLGITCVPVVAELLSTSGLAAGEVSNDFLWAMVVAGSVGVLGALGLPHCHQGWPLEDFVGSGEESSKFRQSAKPRVDFHTSKQGEETGPLLNEHKFPYGNELRTKSSYDISHDPGEKIAAFDRLGVGPSASSCGEKSDPKYIDAFLVSNCQFVTLSASRKEVS